MTDKLEPLAQEIVDYFNDAARHIVDIAEMCNREPRVLAQFLQSLILAEVMERKEKDKQ